MIRTTCRRLALAVSLGSLAACAHAPAQLYSWGTFPHQQYVALQAEGGDSHQQIADMETQVQKASSSNAALPPGFRAHLGMLYLDTGDVAKARSLWLAEKTAFPESAPYMDSLLKRLDGQPAASKTGDHA